MAGYFKDSIQAMQTYRTKEHFMAGTGACQYALPNLPGDVTNH